MKVELMSTTQILAAINTLQGVQAENKPTSTQWQSASELLAELFAEMDKREKGGFQS